MNMFGIERALLELQLSGIVETLNTGMMQTQAAPRSFFETFVSLMQDAFDLEDAHVRPTLNNKKSSDNVTNIPFLKGIITHVRISFAAHIILHKRLTNIENIW